MNRMFESRGKHCFFRKLIEEKIKVIFFPLRDQTGSTRRLVEASYGRRGDDIDATAGMSLPAGWDRNGIDRGTGNPKIKNNKNP
jgi:hypothetical protein